MGKRYGSKAAYEASRAEARAHRDKWDRWFEMTDEERAKERARERIEEDGGLMMFTLFMAASMAGGSDAKKAIGQADIAVAELKKRFT